METRLILGGLLVLYGIVTLAMRFVAPNTRMFWKLGPMKERWGEGPGTAMHFISYTVLPLGMGLWILRAYLVSGSH
jgi:hypothetical protein